MKWIIIVSAAIAAWLSSTLAALQLAGPGTACTVSESQIAAVKLETMTYADVSRMFGCEGKLAGRRDYGEVVIENFAWRGEAWPYGAFDGEFINGVLHGTKKTWLIVGISAKES